jgi:pimeloyl-ACP methyl ester carboxylesterase
MISALMMRNRKFKKNRILPKWKLIIAIYIVLLIISFIIRQYYPVNIEPALDQNTLTLSQKVSGGSHKSIVKIAYIDAHSGYDQNTPVILLIHGNPVAACRTFQGIIPDLSRFGRVITPELPGFGAATRDIADYSNYAQARYMLGLLDRLKIG